MRRLASSVLGVLGSGLGFLYSYALMSSIGDDSFGWPILQTFLGWPMLVGSVIGLAGSALYPVFRRVGGMLLLSGGILVSPLPFFIATDIWPSPAFLLSFGTKFSRGFLVVSRGVAGFPKDPSPHQDVARRRMDTLARLSDRVTGLAELRTQFSEWWQVSICLSETRRVS